MSHLLDHWVAGSTGPIRGRPGRSSPTPSNWDYRSRLMDYLSMLIRLGCSYPEAMRPERRSALCDTWAVVRGRLGFDSPPFELLGEEWRSFELCNNMGDPCGATNPSACRHN